MSMFEDAVKLAKAYLKTTKGKLLVDILKADLKIAKTVYTTVKEVRNLTRVFKLVSSLHPEEFAELGSTIAKQGIVGISHEASMSVRLLSKVLGTSTSTAAKTLKVFGGSVSIVLGTWDVVWGSIDLWKGSDVVKDLNVRADDLETTKNDLITAYYNVVDVMV